ncbi:MAG: hypothetical protein HQK67_03470 [Desulfamplus sp.]|nr:hypothetical protein [Desulfamplus sp.]
MTNFKPNCLPLLVGSLPMNNHLEATRLVLQYTPDIPLWVQLPVYKEEGMLYQFLPGMPGLTIKGEDFYIDTTTERFEDEVLAFYEAYMSIMEISEKAGETSKKTVGNSEKSGQKSENTVGNSVTIEDAISRFALTERTAKGFSIFMETIKSLPNAPVSVKGQVTGPITMGIGVKDQAGRLLFYDDRMRDIVTKQVAMSARWQTIQLSKLNTPHKPIIFFDEPGVVGFGSSTYISITREQITESLKEGIDAVHQGGGLAGIHICANGDWSLALESGTDIINFDAYSYFDRLILYKEHLTKFMLNNGILAWGIVPTANPEYVEKASLDSLWDLWQDQVQQLESLGISRERILSQSLITPSCGTGSLSLEHAKKVLFLTNALSKRIVSYYIS